MTPTEDQIRNSLQESIRHCEEARGRVTGQQAILDRASSYARSLSDSMTRHDTIEASRELQVAADLAEQFRRGETVPTDSTKSVEIVDKPITEIQLKIAQHARDSLHQELTEHQTRLNAAEEQVRQAAFEVMRSDADRIAEIIEDYERKLLKLRTLLRGLESAEFILAKTNLNSQWVRPKLIRSRAQVAMQRPEEPQFIAGNNPTKESAIQWKNYFDALLADPHTRFIDELIR